MAKGATIYSYYSNDHEGTRAFLTMAEARDQAQAESERDPEYLFEVIKIETPPLNRQLLIDVINSQGGQYSEKETVIAAFKGGRLHIKCQE